MHLNVLMYYLFSTVWRLTNGNYKMSKRKGVFWYE